MAPPNDPYTPTKEEVTARARQLWQQAGQPSGRDEEFWFSAEAELRKDRQLSVNTAKNNPQGERRPGQVAPPP
jgi:hypothetical protein